MKGTTIVALAVAVLLGTATLSGAGTQPSPFEPEINQLGAVENALTSCFDRVNKVLGMPPNDIEPSPNVIGAVNRLEAIDGQLNSLNDFIVNIVYSVMGTAPSPFRLDVIPPLEGVQGAAQGIVDVIKAFLSTPPDDQIPVDFINALGGVLGSTEGIVNQTTQYIQQLQGECTMPCIEHTTQVGCETIGCVWHDVQGASGYCCNQ